MHLCTVRVSVGLHKQIPVMLVVLYVMLEVCLGCSPTPFGRVISLWVLRHRSKVFSAELGQNGWKELDEQ